MIQVQWNAATAITKLIQAGRGDLQAVTALLTTLKTSKNVKVRKSIVHALEALETQTPNFAETVEDELEQVSVQPDEKGQDLPYDQLVKSNALDESVSGPGVQKLKESAHNGMPPCATGPTAIIAHSLKEAGRHLGKYGPLKLCSLQIVK